MSTQGILGNFGCPFFRLRFGNGGGCGSEPACEGRLIADLSLRGLHIHSCGNGRLWFRPYCDSLFFQTGNAKKSKQKKARPERPAPRLGSAFLRSGIHLGASPPVGFASTSSRCVRLRRTALRAHPPDERLHSASRRGEQIKIKSRRANARPNEW